MSYEEPELMTEPTKGTDLPGFHSLLGYRQVSWEEDEAVLELELQPRHLNLGGVIHGGVLTSLLDIVLAKAGTYCPYPGRMRKAITLSLTTSFMGTTKEGRIYAIAKRRGGGRSVFFASCEVYSPEGTLIAMGEGTYKSMISKVTSAG